MERVAHLVLMQLLPALVEDDLRSFGAALTEVQRVTGAWFASQQGGIFAPGPFRDVGTPDGGVGRRRAWDRAPGGRRCTVWWGARPRAGRWRQRAAELLGSGGQVFEGGFAAHGSPGLAGRTGRNP